MVKFAAIIAAVLVYLGFSKKTKVPIESSTAEWDQGSIDSSRPSGIMSLDDLYKKHGKRHGLDWRLLKAIAQVESNEDPQAKNQADPSFGLMQILCQDDGMGSCKNKLNILDWPPASKSELFDPDYSLHIGAQILSWNINQYGLDKGIAVYNSWSARHAPNDGPFPNQGYVDKVWAKYTAILA